MIKTSFLFRSLITASLTTGAILFATPAFAGADLRGIVNGMQVAQDGTIWFSVASAAGTPDPAGYCKPGWAGLNMFVPPNNPQYAYYYGLLLASLTKGISVYVANISVFNGSTACDITQTGYGLLIIK